MQTLNKTLQLHRCVVKQKISTLREKLKYSMGKAIQFKVILKGLLYGFFLRILFDQVNNFMELKNFRENVVETIQQKCQACDQQCPTCLPKEIFVDQTQFVKEAYKPKGMYEVTRWMLFDDVSAYDIINEEPKVAITGHWKDEIKVMTQLSMMYINHNRLLGQKWSLVKLQNGLMKTDSMRGTDFLIDVIAVPQKVQPKKTDYKLFRVHLVHPLQQIDQLQLKTVRVEPTPLTKLVVSTSQDTRYAETLIENIDKTIKENQLMLMLVPSDRRSVEAKMIKIKEKYKKLKIELIKKRENNLLSTIQWIAKTSPDDIIATVQEDMIIDDGFLHHCKTLCHKGKQLYFPIAFAQYNPDVIEKGMPPGKPKNVDKKDHNKFTGYWLHSEKLSVCAYGKDWNTVLARSKAVPKHNQLLWLYNKFLLNNYNVITAVEPHLYKANYKNKCVKQIPLKSKFEQCLKTLSRQHGSKNALGILYLTENKRKKVR